MRDIERGGAGGFQDAPQVVVAECADSSVNLLLRFWIRDDTWIRSMIRLRLLDKRARVDRALVESRAGETPTRCR